MKPLRLLFFLLFLPLCAKLQAPDPGKYFNSFDGTKIYYEVKGNGQPVLLIHGFMSTSQSWKKTALYNDLLAAGYKAVLLDLRGNGKSDKPHTCEAYSNDAEAKDAIALMKMLHTGGYYVVGYSRGSIIVSRILLLDKNISKGVIGGMGIDFTDPAWPRRQLFYRALIGEPVKELEEMIAYVKKAGFDQSALACQQKEQPSTSKKEIASIQIPMLIVNGNIDSANGSAKKLAGLFTNVRYREVPGNHNEAAGTKAFSDSVLEFFKEE